MKRSVLFVLSLLTPIGVWAQQVQVRETQLPPGFDVSIVEFLNDPGTILFLDRGRVAADSEIVGEVGVLGGSMALAGRIDGGLMVVNGDLVIDPGGRISGDVIVVGGEIVGDLGAIAGSVAVYEQSLSYSFAEGRVNLLPSGRPNLVGFAPTIEAGRSRLTARIGNSYNRVEGLPVMFGPILETGGDHPLRLEAFGIFRTGRGLDLDAEDMGYRLRLEQNLTNEPRFSVGATLRSEIVPIESWGIDDVESSLATFLIHKDFRDFDERQGWSAFLRYQKPFLDLEVEYRDEDHAFAPVVFPWTVTDNDQPWRPQPLIAAGNLQSLGTDLIVDLRNNRRDPSDGWWLNLKTRWGVAGDLRRPNYVIDSTSEGDPPLTVSGEDIDATFVSGFLDVRKYNRISPTASLNFRTVIAGSLTGDPLPPQFQYAVGGEGSLPGFQLLSGDCGARDVLALPAGSSDPEERVFINYGCDRIFLVQAEFRSRSFFGWKLDAQDEWGDGWDFLPNVDLSPSWSFFVDLGRGWAFADRGVFVADLRRDTQAFIDAGIGLHLGGLGVYLATDLSGNGRGDGQGVNFFVRLNRRF